MRRPGISRRGRSWVVRARVGGGRRVFRSFRSREEAELYLARLLAERARGEARPPSRLTVGELLDDYLRHGEHAKGWKPSTAVDYRSIVARHLRPGFGSVRADRVEPAAVERWRTEALAAGLGRRQAQKCCALLHAAFEHGRRVHRLARNPLDDVPPLRLPYSGGIQFYEPEEVQALARAAAGEQDAALFTAAAFTGLRLGELLALRVGDIDFRGSAVRVERALSAGSVTAPKSGRVRSVPLAPQAARALARQCAGRGDRELVFPGPGGGHLDGSALRRRFRAAQQRAGLRPLRFHDLRHTFGSLAARVAESSRELQEWMGHADTRTTARYTHYRPRGGEAARLARAFEGERLPEAEPAAEPR